MSSLCYDKKKVGKDKRDTVVFGVIHLKLTTIFMKPNNNDANVNWKLYELMKETKGKQTLQIH